MAALVTGLANVQLGRPDEVLAEFDRIVDGSDWPFQAILRIGVAAAASAAAVR